MNTQHHATDDTAGLIGPDDKFITSEGGYRVDTHRVIPACTGPCNQKGGEKCPHPEACQLPDEDTPHVSGAFKWPVLMVMGICLVALCWNLAGVFA